MKRGALRYLKAVKSGMTRFGEDIATLVNSILLLVVYLIGVGVTSIIAKIVGKKFLERKPTGKSYWKPIDQKTQDPDELYRQF